MSKRTVYSEAFLGGTSYAVADPAVDAQQFALPGDALTKWSDALENQNAAVLWVSLGSSTANGGNVPYGNAWYSRLSALLGKNAVIRLEDAAVVPFGGFQFYNGAQGGATSANYLTRQRLDRIRFLQPILVTHMIGSNDFSSGVFPGVYKNRMRSRLKEVLNASPYSVQLLFHQQGRQDVAAPAYRWADYGRALRELSEEPEFRGCVAFLNIDAFMRRLGVPFPDLYSLVSRDGIHLNGSGHRILADVVGGFLGVPRPVLQREVYGGGPFRGGTHTGKTEIYSQVIPARPYPRDVVVSVMVYANIVRGKGDIVFMVEGSEDTPVSIRVSSTVASGISGMAKFRLRANVVGRVAVNAVPYYPGTMYTSADTSFTRFTADLSPA